MKVKNRRIELASNNKIRKLIVSTFVSHVSRLQDISSVVEK